MKKLLATLAGFALVSAGYALETAKIRITNFDGSVSEKQIKLQKQNGGFYRVHIPIADIKRDMKWIDIIADDAVAQKGDSGYWVMGNGASGYFTGEANGEYFPKLLSMQMFGMTKKDAAFVGIIKGLPFEQRPVLKVNKNGVYELFVRYMFDKTNFVPYEDIIVDFYPLKAGKADYNDMAKVYRKYQLDRGEVKLLRERIKNNPKLAYTADTIYVRVRHGSKAASWKNPAHHVQTPENKPPLMVAITFDRFKEIMREMKAAGIEKAEVCSVGWNIDGHDGPFPQFFPVEEKFGGEKKFREAIELGKSLGYHMTCHINHHAFFQLSNRWNPDEAIKNPDGTLFKYGFQPSGDVYLPCMQRMYDLWVKEDFAKIKDLGINGIFHIDVHSCETPFECCDSHHPLNKKQWVEYQNKILSYAHEVFGGFSSECGMDHVAKNLDYGLYMWWSYRREWNTKDGIVQKYVPLWQLVYHGIILHNPFLATVDPLYERAKPRDANDWFQNCRNFISDPEEQWLKVVELGGRPSYYFQNYKTIEPMKRAYFEYQPLKYLQLQLMEHHSEIAKGVFLTRYEFGDEIVVNYTKQPFTYKGQVVPARGYKLFKKQQKS